MTNISSLSAVALQASANQMTAAANALAAGIGATSKGMVDEDGPLVNPVVYPSLGGVYVPPAGGNGSALESTVSEMKSAAAAYQASASSAAAQSVASA